MSLVVEDGSGLANADSYVSLADASTIATSFGLTFAISGGDEPLAEAALRRATVWLDASYRHRFSGWKRRYRAQALEWPRQGAYDTNSIPQYIPEDQVPVEIRRATVIAAVREKASPGSLSPDITPGEITKRLKVGSYEEEYFGAGGVADQRPVVSMVDDVLASLLMITRGPALFGRAERA